MNRKKGIFAFVMVSFLVLLLTACGGSSITTGPRGATFEFSKLTEDDDNETTGQFHFDDGILTVTLERGTANVQICHISVMAGEDDIFDELETIYEGHDLKNGDEVEIKKLRGDVVMRVWGNAGKGTVKIAPKE